MSRLFNGTTDNVTFSAGGAAIKQGPITMAALVRPLSVSGERPVFAGWSGSGFGYIHLVNGGTLVLNDYFGSGPSVTNDVWQWLVTTKASANATPDFYIQQIGGSWGHTAGNQNAFDDADVASQIFVGYDGGGHWSGRCAALAIWDTVLSQSAIQAACTLNASDLKSASPRWMTRWNQASVATAVTDDMSLGGDQAAISGTSVDADEPPGWSYTLTPPPSNVTLTPAAMTLSARTVAPVPGAVTVALTPAALSLTAVALGLPAHAPADLVYTRPDPVQYRRVLPVVFWRPRAGTLVYRR